MVGLRNLFIVLTSVRNIKHRKDIITMKRKMILAMLCVTLSVSSMAGCGASNETKETASEQLTAETETTPEPTAEKEPEPTAEPTPEPTAEPTTEKAPEPTAETTPEPTPAETEEQAENPEEVNENEDDGWVEVQMPVLEGNVKDEEVRQSVLNGELSIIP